MANLYGIGRHDTTHSPAGLWQLDGSLSDDSGNSYDLNLETGTVRYSELAPRVKGLWFDGSTTVEVPAYTPALHITGDVTIEMLVVFADTPGAANSFDILAHGLWPGAGGADNAAYRLYVQEIGSRLSYRHDYATSSDTHLLDDCVPTGQICHLAMVRSSNVVQFYLNGRALGSPSAALNTPDGGASGRFTLGGVKSATGQRFVGGLSSVKVIPSALSAAQVLAEYNLTIGAILPRATAAVPPITNDVSVSFSTATGLSLEKDNPTAMPTQNLSGIIWVKNTSAGGRVYVGYASHTAPNYSWKFAVENGPTHGIRLSFWTSNGAGGSKRTVSYASMETFLALNTWGMLGFTYDGTQIESQRVKIFRGASQIHWTGDVQAYSPLVVPSPGTPFLHHGPTNATSSSFILNYCALFNATLTPGDMGALYNNGVPRDPTYLPSCFYWMRGGNGNSFPPTFDAFFDTVTHVDNAGSNDVTGQVGGANIYTEVDHVSDTP